MSISPMRGPGGDKSAPQDMKAISTGSIAACGLVAARRVRWNPAMGQDGQKKEESEHSQCLKKLQT